MESSQKLNLMLIVLQISKDHLGKKSKFIPIVLQFVDVYIKSNFWPKSLIFLYYFCRLSSECRTTESITNSALCCIECFMGPSSYFLGLLGNRIIRHRNINLDQCKLSSHRHLLDIFYFFY